MARLAAPPPTRPENDTGAEPSVVKTRADSRDDRRVVEGSLRLCVATRTERPPAELIRFVAGPDGVIVPDLARKLPGRGVWVTGDRSHLESAVKSKAFAKSLKRAVTVPEGLADLVERLLISRLENALSLANKAGQLVAGFTKVDKALDGGQIAVLAQASDASDDGRDKLARKFRAIAALNGRTAAIVDLLTTEQMSLAIGRPNVVHAGLIPGGATDGFLVEAERLMRYRSGLVTSDDPDRPPTTSSSNG